MKISVHLESIFQSTRTREPNKQLHFFLKIHARPCTRQLFTIRDENSKFFPKFTLPRHCAHDARRSTYYLSVSKKNEIAITLNVVLSSLQYILRVQYNVFIHNIWPVIDVPFCFFRLFCTILNHWNKCHFSVEKNRSERTTDCGGFNRY